MDKLKISNDSRITFDQATGAVRSFFGEDLVESQAGPNVAAAAAEAHKMHFPTPGRAPSCFGRDWEGQYE